MAEFHCNFVALLNVVAEKVDSTIFIQTMGLSKQKRPT